jgi:cyclomaltodextrinase / maltogenic alpha-amylase / neopullulanase
MDRRSLLRRTGAMAAAGVLTGKTDGHLSARTPEPEATPATEAPVSLDLLGGDVWAWEKVITGTVHSLPADATIEISVNGDRVPAVRSGDQFGVTVRLAPGENEVAAVATLADGEEVASDPVIHVVRLDPRPTSRVIVGVEDGVVVLDGTASEPSEFDGAAIESWAWSTREDNPEQLSLIDGGETLAVATPGASPVVSEAAGGATNSVIAPTSDGEYYVSLLITDAEGRTDTSTASFVVEEGVARVVDPVVEEAAWVERAVVYGMVVRNFTGQGFAGVTERMQELKDLGITALWFAPITRTLRDLFGYEVTDYFDVRPEYGTLEDFRELVDEAHAHGIRVLMDFVPNHTSYRHPYFVDAEEHGEASPYFDYFDRNDGGGYTYYFEWSHLPNLNFDNPEVRRFMTEAFTFWVREYGVDGFRADVAWGIKERRPDYWLEWSAELNRIKPNSLLISEASARDPFYVENGFDAAYDWTDELGVWAWGDVFALGFPMSMAMPEALTNHGEGYHPDSLVFRFLNNNDTGMRFVSVYGVDRYRAALALMMTLPGIPCLYTGDEVGAQFLPYESVGEISWDDPNDIRPYVKRLIELRTPNPSLYSRNWVQIDVEPAVELFGYLRHEDGEDPIVVIVNYSRDDVEGSISLPEMLAGTSLVDLWADELLNPNGTTLTLDMPAWGLRVLKAGQSA